MFIKGHTTNVGRKCSDETKAKIGNKHRGKIVSEEARENIRNAHIGKKPSELCMQRSMESRVGKKLSDETKLKIRETRIKRTGGKTIDKSGYILISMPSHPNCNSSGYVQEHRLVMEKHLERFLESNEFVHHKDGNKTNNEISNLELFTSNRMHMKHHGEKMLSIKLNEEQIKDIFMLRKKGSTLKNIAEKYEVHLSTISRILKNNKYFNP